MKKIIIFITILILFLGFYFIKYKTKDNYMIDLSNYNIENIKSFALKNNLELNIKYEYNEEILVDKVISQTIKPNEKLKKGDVLEITISLGSIKELYKKNNVNELGKIPVMMYHRIKKMNNEDTKYIGGNIDSSGYERTTESFIADLEFYYNSGYRMIRLEDFVNGIIDVELGYSPIILTFDDGINNIKVTGLDENGNIIIDPNSAIGILEQFKKKYPDFNVTATFFLNNQLFYSSKYSEKIIIWLINNGYDIGNHGYIHANINNLSTSETQIEIGKMYQKLEKIIPGKYVNIVALPYGNPKKNHENFKYILNGNYNNYKYKTISTLRVGSTASESPFDISFDKTYIKRIRAYNNNGKKYNIEYNFKKLENTRYISDGNIDTVVITKDLESKLNTTKKIISY